MRITDALRGIVVNAVAAHKARSRAWKRVTDGHYRRSYGDTGEHLHVIDGKVFVADKFLSDVQEITGEEATQHISECNAVIAIKDAKQGGSSDRLAAYAGHAHTDDDEKLQAYSGRGNSERLSLRDHMGL